MSGFRPRFEGEIPTLGWVAAQWIERMLCMPGFSDYRPFRLYPEQVRFLCRFYALDPVDGGRVFYRGVLSRPRGWGKSPFGAAIVVFETVGPCVFDGWDSEGRPRGRPWARTRPGVSQVAACTVEQTQNAWVPLMSMLRDNAPLREFYDCDVQNNRIFFGHDCEIARITSSARSIKGAPSTFALLDQTEAWTRGNHGVELAETIRGNTAKTGGSSLEVPNAFMWGEGSVAELSYLAAEKIRKNRSQYTAGVLFDHREADINLNINSKKEVLEGIEFAYGDSVTTRGGHVDPRHLLKTFFDPSQPVDRSRADFLNQISAPASAWVTREQVENIMLDSVQVSRSEPIFIGFDGSIGSSDRVSDSTTLVGCTVDGVFFNIRTWEAPLDRLGWEPPREEVDYVVRKTLEGFKVFGFFADPYGWFEQVNAWSRDFGRRLLVKCRGAANPISIGGFRDNKTIGPWFEELRQAVALGECKIADRTIAQHFVNARKVYKDAQKTRYLLYKSSSSGVDKIDCAYAATLAWAARAQAMRLGLISLEDKGESKKSKLAFG